MVTACRAWFGCRKSLSTQTDATLPKRMNVVTPPGAICRVVLTMQRPRYERRPVHAHANVQPEFLLHHDFLSANRRPALLSTRLGDAKTFKFRAK